MTSEKLRQVRAYEEEKRAEIKPLLPLYHLTGGVGWINDPNGFSVYRGEYHLFFQYYPFDTTWGPMHWGHARSKDLLHWEYLPAALAPDAECDRDGCYSGSAAETPDGRQVLLYTGVRKEPQPDGTIKEIQYQCVAFGDGLDYEKDPGNPVIGPAELPAGGSSRDFRDPKLWWEDGRWHAVVANFIGEDKGSILLYESEDARRWQLVGQLAESRGRLGTMWECPDLFRLDGRDVLIHSAHEMRAEGLEFHPGDGTVCHIGHLDKESCRLHDEHVQAMDYGLDYYAPQSLETPDGRRVQIAWMQSWAAANCRPELPFFGQMTVPRELRIENGRLYQWPVRELEACRKDPVRYRGVRVESETRLPGVHGRVQDLELRLTPAEGGYRRFSIRFAVGEDCYTEILLLPEEERIHLDRRHSGFPHDINHERDVPVHFRDGTLRLRLLLDRYSAELFVNGGEQAASLSLYTPLTAEGITFSAQGAVLLDVDAYTLKME